MHYWLVMPAAGSGSRFGAALAKQYTPLAGRTVIEWALAPFLADARCEHLVVALPPQDEAWPPVAARLARQRPGAVSAVTGGERRSHSVRLALEALNARAAAEDWVLVHDAARPCLGAGDLDRLLERGARHPVGGLLAVPLAETLKRAAGPGSPAGAAEVAGTLDRSHLWRALTPQMFRYGRLCAALDAAHAAARFPGDEAQALEWLGERPLLVGGAATNLKITRSADLPLAAAVLAARAIAAGPGDAREGG
jgi:2-C-methyl-D-erythritol 4-phosphate cytidylyltransferase